jgi:hypothetical protein
MPMETVPESALILIPAQQLLRVLMKAFDLMPRMGVLDQYLQPRRRRRIAPVLIPITALL